MFSFNDMELFAEGGLLYAVVLACVILLVTGIVSHLCIRLFKRAYKFGNEGAKAGSIFSVIIKTCIWAFGLSLVLKICFGFDPSVIWGALGVGGIALSLGLQSTISNLLGGLQISLSKQVSVGDFITVGAITGKVTDINWRCTHVLDENGVSHTVPNNVLNSGAVSTHPAWMRTVLPVTVSYAADTAVVGPALCKAAADALAAAGMRYEGKDEGFVVSGTSAFGVDCKVAVFTTWDFTTTQVQAVAGPALSKCVAELDAAVCFDQR